MTFDRKAEEAPDGNGVNELTACEATREDIMSTEGFFIKLINREGFEAVVGTSGYRWLIYVVQRWTRQNMYMHYRFHAASG
jgi:hypothetical protein